MSKYVLSCHQNSPHIPLNRLLLLFGGLYLFFGLMGIIYTIFKEISFAELQEGRYSLLEAIELISSGRICDEALVDIWSLPHFIGHSFLVFLFVRLGLSKELSAFLSLLISFLWEFVERAIVEYAYNFACESWGNSIMDIVIGGLGIILAYVVLKI